MGWVLNTSFQQACVTIGHRILTSARGKKETLEMIEKGIEKLERKGDD